MCPCDGFGCGVTMGMNPRDRGAHTRATAVSTRATPLRRCWRGRESEEDRRGETRWGNGLEERGLIQFNYVMNCRVLSKHPSSPRLAAGKSVVGDTCFAPGGDVALCGFYRAVQARWIEVIEEYGIYSLSHDSLTIDVLMLRGKEIVFDVAERIIGKNYNGAFCIMCYT